MPSSSHVTCHLVGFPPPGVLTAEAQREFQAADDLVLALFFDKIMLVVVDGKSPPPFALPPSFYPTILPSPAPPLPLPPPSAPLLPPSPLCSPFLHSPLRRMFCSISMALFFGNWHGAEFWYLASENANARLAWYEYCPKHLLDVLITGARNVLSAVLLVMAAYAAARAPAAPAAEDAESSEESEEDDF